MNILILANVNTAGEWLAQQNLIEEIKKKDKKINFFLISEKPKNKNFIKTNLFKKILFLTTSPTKKPFKKYKKTIFYIYKSYLLIKKLKNKNNINKTFISHYPFFLSYFSAFKNFNYIFWFHGIKNNYKIFKDTLNHYLIFLKILENFAWIFAEKLIIPTYESLTLIKKNLILPFKIEKKVILINNLINPIFFKKNKSTKKKNIIIYSGRLVYKKGIENLILAFKKFLTFFNNWTLLICYLKLNNIEEKKILRKYQKEKNIVFKANLNQKQLKKYYQQAKIAILPSSLENSSLFLKEALMLNLPVFSTKTGNSKKYLSKHFLIRNNQINTIFETLKNFAKNQLFYNQKFARISLNFNKIHKQEKKQSIEKFLNFIYEK